MIRRTPTSAATGGPSRRSALNLALAGSLIAGSGLIGVVAAFPAAAVDPVPSPVTLVTIEGSGTAVTANAYEGASKLGSEKLNSSKGCSQSTVPAGILGLAPTPTTSTVGIYGLSVGVAEPKSGNGSSCSQVSTVPSEALTVSVKVPTSDQDTTPKSAAFAVLDVEVQKDVVVEAVLHDNTKSPSLVGTYTLYSGLATTANWTPADPLKTQTCKVGSTSSSPNSNSSDNCKWQLNAPAKFDTIILKARYKGQFSLEGGSDWTGGAVASTGGLPTNATYFWLGEVCTIDPAPEPIKLKGASDATGSVSTWLRLPYNADGSPCLDSGKTGSQDGNTITFTDDGSQPFAQYLFEIQWTAPANSPVVTTTVDFGLNDPNGAVPLPWCPDSLWDDGGSDVEGLTSQAEFDAAALPDYDFATSGGPKPNNGKTQYACTYGKTPTGYDKASKTYTWTEQIYLLGDVIFRG